MYGLSCTTQPASEPITTSLLKSHLRLNTTDEDSLLAMYITAARQLFESYTERACITSTWRLYMDAFPRVIRLPKAPLQSVTSVQYYDTTNNLVTWSNTNYSVDIQREPGRIVPNVWFPGWQIWPCYPALSWAVSPKIIVEFVAGWTTNNVPALVQQGILLLASHFYANREALTADKLSDLPLGFQAICSQYALNWTSNMNAPMFGDNYNSLGVD